MESGYEIAKQATSKQEMNRDATQSQLAVRRIVLRPKNMKDPSLGGVALHVRILRSSLQIACKMKFGRGSMVESAKPLPSGRGIEASLAQPSQAERSLC